MAYKADFRALRATMERCSDIVTEAYAKPAEQLLLYTGELPPGHRSTDRRQRYLITEHNGDMVVALPGTTHPLDWSSNLRVHYKPIDGSDVPADQLEEVPCAHAGFYYRAETVPTLQLLQQAADRGCRLVFTGHSLGGAVANLCTLTALSAQKKALTAAANKAAAAAPQSRLRRSKSKTKLQEASAAKNNRNNHSCCSSNSDTVLTPQAALVEVLCISFASPIYANAALAQLIDESGWDECFVNVVVPEDYCLKLFNNVLTSAQPEARSQLSRTCSKSSFRQAADFSDAIDPYDTVPEPFEPHPDPLMTDEVAAAAAAAAGLSPSNVGSSSSSSSSSSNQPRYSYTGGQQQQPLVSALAGKSARCKQERSKRQLSFAHPVHSTLSDGSESGSEPSDSAAYVGATDRNDGCKCEGQAAAAAAADSSWGDDATVAAGMLPSSTSSTSLYAESEDSASMSSTRSWTLLAYLPDMFTRSFSSRSLSSWSGSIGSNVSSSNASSRGPSTDTGPAAGSAVEGWGMRHARSSVDLAHVMSLSSNSSSSDSLCSLDHIDHMDNLAEALAHAAALDDHDDDHAMHTYGSGSSSSSHSQQRHQEQRSLRKSFSSASLTLLSQGHKKLLQPITSTMKLTDSMSVVRNLLPSMRSVVHASRAVVSAATGLTEKAFSVPLNVLEVGLIQALKPPMYQPVGQQWILSATGLVPQQQAIQQYPRHVHDVFWHKELMLVAFKEHSILFYKQRLLKQASRR